MPKDGLEWLPKPELLTYEELAYLTHHFVDLGINRVRITGGEPTLRKDLTKLIKALNQIKGLEEISLTTNGTRMKQLAGPLAEAGLSRVNISIDAAEPKRFAELTRSKLDRFFQVDSGIRAAAERFHTVKLNAVILKEHNEDQLFPLIDYTAQLNRTYDAQFQLRFIEYMPFQQRWFHSVPSAQLIGRIQKAMALNSLDRDRDGGPAEMYTLPKIGVDVGFITPLSERFCASCNRLRLTADGELRTCLAHQPNASLRALIRGQHSDQQLHQRIQEITRQKQLQHNCETDGGALFDGVMTAIGG